MPFVYWIRAAAFAALGLATMGPAYIAAQSAPVTDVAGKELRTSIPVWDYFQDHLWRFRSDGTVSGTYDALRGVGELAHALSGSDTGKWSVENGDVCVQWQRWFKGARTCYRIDRTDGIWIKASPRDGRKPLIGTLAPYP